MTPARWALHIGLKGDYSSDVIGPAYPIIETGPDRLTFDLGDRDTTTDERINVGIGESYLVRGSWQEWGEPEAESYDLHLVTYSVAPWTRERIAAALSEVRSRLTMGRTFDYVQVDDADVWGEHATTWTDDGETLYPSRTEPVTA